MSAAGHLPGSEPATDVPAAVPAAQGRRRGLAGYLLLLPGGAWLALFFVVPTLTLVATSLYDPAGSLQLGYQMTWHWQKYLFRDCRKQGAGSNSQTIINWWRFSGQCGVRLTG